MSVLCRNPEKKPSGISPRVPQGEKLENCGKCQKMMIFLKMDSNFTILSCTGNSSGIKTPYFLKKAYHIDKKYHVC